MTFHLTKLALLVPEGRGMAVPSSGACCGHPCSPSPFQGSLSSTPFTALHAGSLFLTDTALPHLLHFVIPPEPQAKASELFHAKFGELCVASNYLHHCKRHTWRLPAAYQRKKHSVLFLFYLR